LVQFGEEKIGGGRADNNNTDTLDYNDEEEVLCTANFIFRFFQKPLHLFSDNEDDVVEDQAANAARMREEAIVNFDMSHHFTRRNNEAEPIEVWAEHLIPSIFNQGSKRALEMEVIIQTIHPCIPTQFAVDP